MTLARLNRLMVRRSTKYYSTAAHNEEYTAVPQYPKILDTSFAKTQERKKQQQHDLIKTVKTVEEKQIKLNMPKYYGFKCYKFLETKIPYNSLQLAQHITRTHLKEDLTLPDYYKDIQTNGINIQNLKSKIEDALLVELEGYKTTADLNNASPEDVENTLTRQIVSQINRICINNLVQDFTYLLDSQVDLHPRIESVWFAGGMKPPKNIKRYRTGKFQEWRKDTENDPTDRIIQYEGQPVLTIRNTLPLPPFIPVSEALIENYEVPKWVYDPRSVGIATHHSPIANVPGFWPGDPHSFGMLSYHQRGHMINRHFHNDGDDKDAIHRQAILAGFGWLSAQANFLGFNTFNDITYPLATQVVITNGQLWSFYAYQLNTMLVHGKNIDENEKVNMCFATPELKLFEEYKDGKLIGFNEDVLKMIIQLYTNAPLERMGVNLRPYLSSQEKLIADYEDVEKREWLEREYKHLVSRKPRFKLPYEVYSWEKIYKVDHKTRPMDKRRRPFELFIKPSDRKLNERQAFYIPKALRPDLPKHKGRYAKEYFP